MLTSNYTDALREAYALAPASQEFLETLELAHPNIDTIWIARSKQSVTATLENGTEQTFEPSGFDYSMPVRNEDGIQEMDIRIDNVRESDGSRVSSFLQSVVGSEDKVYCRYRIWFANDLTTPQLSAPIELVLTAIVVTDVDVAGKATFADFINKEGPRNRYTRSRFPAL